MSPCEGRKRTVDASVTGEPKDGGIPARWKDSGRLCVPDGMPGNSQNSGQSLWTDHLDDFVDEGTVHAKEMLIKLAHVKPNQICCAKILSRSGSMHDR